ncbi:MAG: hypothetical protein IT317_11530 [Anaerolineales bacterium]|nr:hypothetical protein [Anaerolineales bacterium]
MDEKTQAAREVALPVIVDMGSQKAKKLKELKKGEGELWEEVQGVVDQVQQQLGERLQGQTVLPIIILYEKKTTRQRLEQLVRPYLRAWR